MGALDGFALVFLAFDLVARGAEAAVKEDEDDRKDFASGISSNERNPSMSFSMLKNSVSEHSSLSGTGRSCPRLEGAAVCRVFCFERISMSMRMPMPMSRIVTTMTRRSGRGERKEKERREKNDCYGNAVSHQLVLKDRNNLLCSTRAGDMAALEYGCACPCVCLCVKRKWRSGAQSIKTRIFLLTHAVIQNVTRRLGSRKPQNEIYVYFYVTSKRHL